MSRIYYFSWLEKYYPADYESITQFSDYAYYRESYALTLIRIKEALPLKMQGRIYGSGDEYRFCYIEYYGCPRNRCYQRPDALIKYVKNLKPESLLPLRRR